MHFRIIMYKTITVFVCFNKNMNNLFKREKKNERKKLRIEIYIHCERRDKPIFTVVSLQMY